MAIGEVMCLLLMPNATLKEVISDVPRNVSE